MSAFYIGVDGGGSKTRFYLSNEEGEAIKTVETPSTNKNSVGVEQAKKTLLEGFGLLAEHPSFSQSQLVAVCAGMAGVNSNR